MTGRYVGSRLILSCDLVGSTRRKQSDERSATWIRVFLEFYRLFPALLRNELAAVPAAATLSPRLWKAVGDELVFICDVATEDDVYVLVSAWIAAMDKYEREHDSGLATKGGAFIATFPQPDREVRIAQELQASTDTLALAEVENEHALTSGAPDHLEDFLGPSIDTGFRVMARASHRYFTMSVEVTWAYAAYLLRNNSSPDTLRLHEEVTLKGVWSDRAYPVFALDREHDSPIHAALAELRGVPRLQSKQICELCAACTTLEDWPSSLYLPGSANAEFKRAGDGLRARADFLDGLYDSLDTWPAETGDDGRDLPDDVPQS